MLHISVSASGEIFLSGRFDASQEEKARETFSRIATTCTVDFTDLKYISSAGLRVLLETEKRLGQTNERLKLRNLNEHIQDLFRYSGLDRVFEIE
jgi:anti-anti-sigma factor